MMTGDVSRAVRCVTFAVTLCEACLEGQPSGCDTPACALYGHDAPPPGIGQALRWYAFHAGGHMIGMSSEQLMRDAMRAIRFDILGRWHAWLPGARRTMCGKVVARRIEPEAPNCAWGETQNCCGICVKAAARTASSLRA